MSKILVVEPHKILQRAIAVSFFPEHELQIVSSLPETSSLEGFDVLVIDAGALREKISVGEMSRRVLSWQIPTIWLDETVSPVAPSREKLVVLRKPIDKHALIAALARCQEESTPSRGSENEKQPDDAPAADTVSAMGTPVPELKPKPARIIELVDVVEEGPVQKRGKRSERKKK